MSTSGIGTHTTSDDSASIASLEEDEEEDRELLRDGEWDTDPIDKNGGLSEQLMTEDATAYIWFLVVMISISGLLFGLDTGIICTLCKYKFEPGLMGAFPHFLW